MNICPSSKDLPMHLNTTTKVFRHFHFFCGLGGGAKGFNKGTARVGNLQARFRCIGGIDVDPGAIRDFERLAGVPGTVLDLFDRDQYKAFHGHEPPPEWRPATTDDVRRAAGNERPHIVFLSAPCKGFSGLLSQKLSTTAKYQALNGLTLRGVWLMLEAWSDDPPELIIFENVPRIASRGRHLLDQIGGLLRQYGYAVAETTHDCGVIGGLGQSRKRFLLVARHQVKVPPFLYEPAQKSLRGVGDVLDKLPLPGVEAAGPMHRVPALQWKTWVRLAFVEAGSDWRSLNRLRVEDGVLKDYGIAPETAWHAGTLGVLDWRRPAGTVTGNARAVTGAFSVADPRPPGPLFGKYAVVPFRKAAGTVLASSTTGQGAFAVQDPRYGWGANTHRNKMAVVDAEQPARTVTGSDRVGSGAMSVADPRPVYLRGGRDQYVTAGNYGVLTWQDTAGAVAAAGQHDNGRWSVADPRVPEATEQGVFVIRALDDTWHRPFTTLELAALQSLVDPEEYLELEGLSDAAWRERIGNAVPPDAAQAIADVMGRTLLLAWSGETFVLSNDPIWVRSMTAALSVAQGNAG